MKTLNWKIADPTLFISPLCGYHPGSGKLIATVEKHRYGYELFIPQGGSLGIYDTQENAKTWAVRNFGVLVEDI